MFGFDWRQTQVNPNFANVLQSGFCLNKLCSAARDGNRKISDLSGVFGCRVSGFRASGDLFQNHRKAEEREYDVK